MSIQRAVRVWVSAAFVAAAMALAWQASPVVRAQAPYDASLYSGLSWRMLGPFRGGRVDAVSGVPGRPNEFYFGAVNGGVWKTIDAGRVWTPIFDSQPVASIGALAVAPSAPDTIYVGTGESTLRDSMSYGNGMYKSTDAGKTWTHIGLDDTQHIGKIAVDPGNAEPRLRGGHRPSLRGAPGPGRLPLPGRRKTWNKVLFKNDSVGAADVVIDPTNPRIVYASLWNTRRPTWYTYQPTNGPGGGLFKSTDGGTTWNQLTNGLPTTCVGKTGIAIAPSNPQRLYAVVDDFLPEGAAADTPCPGAPPGRGAGAGAAARPAPAGDAGLPQPREQPLRPPHRAASTDRTTPARRGRSCPATPPSGVVAGISSTSSSIRKTRTSCTWRTWRCRDRRTAARRGNRCAAPPAATTTSSHGSLRMIPTR